MVNMWDSMLRRLFSESILLKDSKTNLFFIFKENVPLRKYGVSLVCVGSAWSRIYYLNILVLIWEVLSMEAMTSYVVYSGGVAAF